MAAAPCRLLADSGLLQTASWYTCMSSGARNAGMREGHHAEPPLSTRVSRSTSSQPRHFGGALLEMAEALALTDEALRLPLLGRCGKSARLSREWAHLLWDVSERNEACMRQPHIHLAVRGALPAGASAPLFTSWLPCPSLSTDLTDKWLCAVDGQSHCDRLKYMR
jgi:hypothetical protein